MSSSRPSPSESLSSSGVFPVYACLEFDASVGTVEDVWNVLMDFESYGSWNPFIRKQTILSTSSSNIPSKPTPGQQMLLTVHTPPQLSNPHLLLRPFQVTQTFVRIKVVDHENHCLAWRTTDMSFPAWLLWCERWQMVTSKPSTRSENDKETTESSLDEKIRYESYEVFGGFIAYVMWILCLKWLLLKGVVEMAEALKKRTEMLKKGR